MAEYARRIFLALSRLERRVFLVAAVAVVVGALGTAGTAIQASTELVPAEGGTYTEGMVGQPVYINPVLARTTTDRALAELLFAPLPQVAESISVDETGRAVHVRLMEGLRWSDGTEITSDDVIFTVERIQDPDTNSPLFSRWQGVRAERVSKLELVFRLAAPYPIFTERLGDFFFIPKHLFADVPSPNWRLSDHNLEPVGNGPFMFFEYESRANGFITRYRMERNPRYAGTAALLDQLDVRFFPNEEELVKEFNSGTVDGFGTLDHRMLEDIQRSHDVIEFPLLSSYAVFWNQSQNLALQSSRVRRALSLAAPVDQIIAEALGGHADRTEGPLPAALLPASSPRNNTELSPREQAVVLLENDGWQLDGEEGVRMQTIRTSRVPLAFDLTVPDIPSLVHAGEMLKASWESLGARVELIVIPPQSAPETIVKNRDYDALLFGMSIPKTGDLFPFWHSSERFYPGLNLALYDNTKADSLMEQVRQVGDAVSRATLLIELHTTITEDDPALFLWSPHYLYAARKDLRGANPEPIEDPATRFRAAPLWHTRTARVLR